MYIYKDTKIHVFLILGRTTDIWREKPREHANDAQFNTSFIPVRKLAWTFTNAQQMLSNSSRATRRACRNKCAKHARQMSPPGGLWEVGNISFRYVWGVISYVMSAASVRMQGKKLCL